MTSQPSQALPEGPCLSPGEDLQEESRRLQQCARELLIRNQRLRILLEPANESPSRNQSRTRSL
jgi:hypothetical protein